MTVHLCRFEFNFKREYDNSSEASNDSSEKMDSPRVLLGSINFAFANHFAYYCVGAKKKNNSTYL